MTWFALCAPGRQASIFSSLFYHKPPGTLQRVAIHGFKVNTLETSVKRHRLDRYYASWVSRTGKQAIAVIRGLIVVIAVLALPGLSQPEAADPVPHNPDATADNVTQHGPLQTVALPLPDLGIQTHPEKAEAFSQKLVAGFGLKAAVATEFSGWILEAAARQHLQPELVASLVFAESSFRKGARSHVGAVGPAQVRPHYWGEFCGQVNLQDPEQNIYCGTQILGYMLERCGGDQACALAAYNIGLNSKRRAAGRRYVAKIDRNMAQLRSTNL